MVVTYEYRLLPSKKQHRALEALEESQRQLYNAALEERIGAYRHGITLTYFDQTKSLTEWRKSDAEAASVAVNLQRATLKRLDEAYKGFFRRVKQKKGKAGFPRFRGKGWWDSFGFRQFSGITFDGTCLRFKGMPGALRVHVHRPMPESASIRSCTFRRDGKGWKVGFAIEVAVAATRDGNRSVGVDLGISTFAALSDGGFIPSLRAARRAHRRLRVVQRSLARKQRRSKNRSKARAEVRRCHGRIAHARSNFLHQASARLVRDYDVIALEALNVRNSSQECRGCGMIVRKSLDERWHDCPHCGLSIDRDLNAARNILGRAGVGPCLLNVADCGKRAGGNLGLSSETHQEPRLPN